MENIQALLDNICGDKYTKEWKNLNYKLVPTTAINATIGSEKEFNELYQALLNSGYERIKRTKSGGISISKERRLYHHHVWDVKQYKSVIEITICKPVDSVMRTYRIQYRNNNYKDIEDNEELVTGYKSFRWFKSELRKDNINLLDYAVSKEEGIKANNEIHKPDIRIFSPSFAARTRIFNACHLDFHKFYMSGLMISHPEMAYTINRLAAESKTNPAVKTMLASVIGYMHSPVCNYKYATLARDAINNSYSRYDEVLELLAKDRKILATNTDGIWYEGEEWHGKFESPELSGWSNDHKNVTIRFKSAGSYEFIENNQYFPVVRGRTKLDAIKDRTEWTWGDIFQITAAQQAYTFIKGEGIVWQKVM